MVFYSSRRKRRDKGDRDFLNIDVTAKRLNMKLHQAGIVERDFDPATPWELPIASSCSLPDP
jgi:hypothetical protein